MGKVTYLFGAGASCGCLPTVKDIPGKIIELRKMIIENRNLSNSYQKPYENCPKLIREVEEEILNECEDLAVQSAKHASIDTYAKKLMITEIDRPQRKYTILKTLLSLSFIKEQLLNNTDERYDGFFASILGDHFADLHKEVKIISWNYDFQFEKAYSLYSGYDDLKNNQSFLKVFPSHLDIESQRPPSFSIHKINGTTAFKEGSGFSELFSTFSNPNHSTLTSNFVKQYVKCIYQPSVSKPMLSFSWENGNRALIDSAKNEIKNSDALVVIGYSYPFFNREIDKQIISFCNPKKIYIQNTNPEAVSRNLSAALEPERSPKIELLKISPNKPFEQFYLPAEL